MSYHDTLLALCDELPDYCMDYLSAKADTQEIRTRVAYAGDLKTFFEYILTRNDLGNFASVKEIPIDIFNRLNHTDIHAYMEYLTEYEYKGATYKNSPAGKKRKLASLKSFCKYYRVIGSLNHNPTELVEFPKLKEKEIVVLSDREKDKLIDLVDTGSRKTERQKKYHEKTRYRDLAILTLFLNTGIRVSELVGIDNYDLDLEEQRILIRRKGGKKEFVYFNEDTLFTICDYLDYERNALLKYDEKILNLNEMPDGPLFVSLKHGRISVRMVEIIIKNYAKAIFPPNVKVTPHTLRKTFGTELYQKYKDLYLVQHALGHSSPSTTAKHYAKYDPEYNKQLREF